MRSVWALSPPVLKLPGSAWYRWNPLGGESALHPRHAREMRTALRLRPPTPAAVCPKVAHDWGAHFASRTLRGRAPRSGDPDGTRRSSVASKPKEIRPKYGFGGQSGRSAYDTTVVGSISVTSGLYQVANIDRDVFVLERRRSDRISSRDVVLPMPDKVTVRS